MQFARYGRFILRTAMVAVVLLVVIAASAIAEQRRTQAEMSAILSDWLSVAVARSHASAGAAPVSIVFERPPANLWKGSEFRRSMLSDPRSSFPQASSITRASFRVSNLFLTGVEAQVHLPRSAHGYFFSRQEFERTAKQGDFDKRFPNNCGYYVVSHAGLNLRKTEAILYYDHICPGLCGGGGYVLLRKLNGVWHVVDEHGVWVS